MKTKDKENYGRYAAMVNDTIAKLECGKFLPNLRGIRKQISEAKKSINILEKGSAFCADMDMLDKTEKALQDAKDRLTAFTAILEYVNKRINTSK